MKDTPDVQDVCSRCTQSAGIPKLLDQMGAWMREHMSQNRLEILPNLTHYEMFMSPELAHTALPFLNEKSGPPSWAEQVEQSK